jgi:hypothetical protein
MTARYAFTPLPPTRGETGHRPEAVAGLSGNWRGRLLGDDNVSDVFTLLRNASVDASVAGRFLFFSTPAVAPTGVRLLEAGDRAFVALIGPYFDPRENADVVTVLEGVRSGTTLEGTFHTQGQHGRHTIRQGRFDALRVEPAHRAA